MGSYIPGTVAQQQSMLREIGFENFEQLYSAVPREMLIKGGLDIAPGLSEMEARRKMEDISEKNVRFRHIFRGAGAYDHYIPAIVKSVTSKEEFVTAYTPYQAEISQGILQSIFEYQSMICDLTGMDVSNASVYDGATAAAEAAAMCRDRKRNICLISACANPMVRKTVETYCFGSGMQVVTIPEKNGLTDIEALEEALAEDSACMYIQQPNYFGCIEDAERISDTVHAKGAKFIMGVYPISLAVLKTPAECGADIAVGDGQPLGIPLSFGGPYLGFMAAKEDMMRKLPGRIIGETTDAKGERAFVLTLQAREQHIRREKAGSNICSNQAHCALTAAVYMAAMGPDGLREAAEQSASKAHYLAGLLQNAGLSLKYGVEFYNEFVTISNTPAVDILKALEKRGYLGGLSLGGKEILWCTTEKNTREEMDEVSEIIGEVRAV
ncbi:MAG: aminomethyl-transferring glycine dehydrogenase subunit GcvPA [Oscillospiraceae bacterium]